MASKTKKGNTNWRKSLRKIFRSPKLLLFAAVFLVLGATLFLGNKGLWRHVKLRHEISVQEDRLAELSAQEKHVQQHVDLLQNEDPTTIERIARERYAMKRQGEIIIRETAKDK